MPLKIEHTGIDDARWDRFVASRDGATFCHLSGLSAAIEDVFGHPRHRLVAIGEDGAWEGVLPLVRVRSLLFGDYLLSMPFVNYGGPIGTPEARALLAHEAKRMATAMEVDLLELRNRMELDSELDVSHRKITVVLPLPDDPEVLWKDGLRSKVRSQVRRPMKEKMTVEFGHEELEEFYRVFARNMRDLGTPVLPFEFFAALRDSLPRELVVCAVRHQGTTVAAGCGFLYRGEFELTWASSLREYNRQAPNMLLYWSLMEEMIRRGAHTFNFGRCTPGSGTHRFKSQWGGEDVPLPWAQWSPEPGTSQTPSPEESAYGPAIAIWRRLPVSVANFLGPWISRSLP